MKKKDGELVRFLVGGIIAEVVIAVQDWMTDGYRIRDVLLKILLGRFYFHSLLVFLGFSFDILSAFFLCCEKKLGSPLGSLAFLVDFDTDTGSAL